MSQKLMTRDAVRNLYQYAMGISLPVVANGVTLAAVGQTGWAQWFTGAAAALFAAAAAIWQNRRAAKMDREEDLAEQEARLLFNHDVAKAVARSIATIVREVAKADDLPEPQRQALRALADQAEPEWLSIAGEAHPAVQPLLEDHVREAILKNPDDPDFPPYGEPSLWRGILRRMAERAGAAALNALPDEAEGFRRAANACRSGFAKRFFIDLKNDLATDGRAFAGVHLRMMGELVRASREATERDAGLASHVGTLTTYARELAQAVIDANRQHRQELVRIGDWLRHLDAGLEKLLGSTRRMEAGVGRVEKKLDDIAEVVVRILEEKKKFEVPASARAEGPAPPAEFTEEEKAIARQALRSADAITRASGYIIQGQTAAAREALQQAAGVLDDADRYFRAMGDSLYFEGRFDDALPWYERAFSLPGRERDFRARSGLAICLWQVRLGDIGAQVRRAIELMAGSLGLVQTRSLDWAMTQNNLGNAWRDLPTGDTAERRKNLRRAITCYKPALSVFADDVFPHSYPYVAKNLATARRALDELGPEQPR